MTDTSFLKRFTPALTDRSKPPVKMDRRLLIEAEGRLEVFYVPFEHVNVDAKVAIVGITPGPNQMVDGNNEARRVLMDGDGELAAITAAKRQAAFSRNPMRANLIAQLNHWGVHEFLGIRSADEVFMTCGEHLVHNTSLLRYPVFFDGEPYNGAPNIRNTVLLRDQLKQHFEQEVPLLPKAIFLTMGKVVEETMSMLVERGAISRDRVFSGMLHPSGQNTSRLQYLLLDQDGRSKAKVPARTNIAHYDNGRARFQKMVLGR